jgi:galactokinase
MRWHPPSSGNSSKAAVSLFVSSFGCPPTGVWAAPGRVNLIGEHVDYAGGVCLPFALSQRAFVAVRLRTDGLLRLVSGQLHTRWSGSLDSIGPGCPQGWPAYLAGVVWAMRKDGLLPADFAGADVAVHSDVPVGAGLSSSAALECSLAVALAELTETDPGLDVRPDRIRLASACVRAENEIALANTGGMDQTVALLAKAGYCLRLDCASGAVEPVPLLLAARELALLVINTNAPHQLVDGQYAQRRASVALATRILGVGSLGEVTSVEWARDALVAAGQNDPVLLRRVRHVITETARAKEAAEALAEVRVSGLGRLLIESHVSLRDDYQVSSPAQDAVVEAAMTAGALGARMVGGGFGGSVIALVWQRAVDEVAEAVAASAERDGSAAPSFLIAEASGAAGRVDG